MSDTARYRGSHQRQSRGSASSRVRLVPLHPPCKQCGAACRGGSDLAITLPPASLSSRGLGETSWDGGVTARQTRTSPFGRAVTAVVV